MITKFKIYESINIGEPEKGDFVIVDIEDDTYYQKGTIDLVNNGIYRLIDIQYEANSTTYVIDFSGTWLVNRKNIIYWSKNSKELEPLLQSKKFNI